MRQVSNSADRRSKAGLRVRPLEPTDTPALVWIDPRITIDAGHAAFVERVSSLGESWIAEHDGALAGFALVNRYFFDRPFIDTLVVAEVHRRRGVGEALLARCEQAHDDDRMFTSTNQSNLAMRALLAKAGWRQCGVIHDLDPGDPELVFVRLRAVA